MNTAQFHLLTDTLFHRFGEECANKILHSDMPAIEVVRSLAWEDSEFFRKWFLVTPKLSDPFVSIEA
ncbi:MAG: hypothetical protein H8E40_00285 [Chloroflexi bacterium]|nr:hypothetical protein [Chloroflexota bacterium]